MEICSYLERLGVRCWIAPRDITFGDSWPKAIMKGLASSSVMVLVLTAESNGSLQVEREVERATSKGIPVITYKAEELRLSESLEFLLSATHWLDASHGKRESHFQELKAALGVLIRKQGLTASSTASRGHTQRPGESEPRVARTATFGTKFHKWIFICLAVLLLQLVLVGYFALRPSGHSSRIPKGLRDDFVIPEATDKYGNPTRQGFFEDGGFPLELRHESTGMHFVFIPAGQFTIGSPSTELDHGVNEGPQCSVRIEKPFYLSKYEMTQREWVNIMRTQPWMSKTEFKTNPIHAASYMSVANCQALAGKLSTPNVRFSVPTEAEWEYACRAGTKTRFSHGDDNFNAKLQDYAWYLESLSGDDDRYPHPVGQKKPNPWGLYDMHGNVWEWCSDWWSDNYPRTPQIDPTGPQDGTHRVIRGGSYNSDPSFCRSASRLGVPVSKGLSWTGLRLLARTH